MSTLVLAR